MCFRVCVRSNLRARPAKFLRGAAMRSDPASPRLCRTGKRFAAGFSGPVSSWTDPFGVRKEPPLPPVSLESRQEKLLDDTEPLLYCDPEFDRQFVFSLS